MVCGIGEFIQGDVEPLWGGKDLASPHSRTDLISTWKFRARHYPHLDDLIHSREKIISYVTDPQIVAKHEFLPFIEHTTISRRFSKYVDSLRFEEAGLSPPEGFEINKPRPIKYASHLDAQIYSFYRHLLSYHYENMISQLGISENVIAYRRICTESGHGKSNIHFAKEAFCEVRRRKDCVAITIDISKFFENLDHKFLKEKWKFVLGTNNLPDDHYRIYKSITDYSYLDQKELYQSLGLRGKSGKYLNCPHYLRRHYSRLCDLLTYRKLVVSGGLIKKNPYRDGAVRRGIPQGSPMSDVLANIYMIDFDVKMARYSSLTGSYYRRYSDDILLICPIGKQLETIEFIANILEQQGSKTLKFNPDKTTKTTFKATHSSWKATGNRFLYLGFRFDGNKVFIRDGSISNFKRRSIKTIKRTVAMSKKSLPTGKQPKVNKSILFQKVLYADKRQLNSRKHGKNKKQALNFISYYNKAKVVFSEPTGFSFELHSRAISRHKRFVENKLQAELKKIS